MILRIPVAWLSTENQCHASSVFQTAEAIVVTAHPLANGALCPRCGTWRSRVHSRYFRKIADFPCCGRRLVLHVSARRFFYVADDCRQKIFRGAARQ
ncbi:transposase family protein [Rhizobium sp. P007]|uniref:transposase family protein n=1 Tax=Rhizobium sp. P007 TaxID=285908 RepID=UPI0011579030|nr:transposase family protein [Rhizobium sp. P007]